MRHGKRSGIIIGVVVALIAVIAVGAIGALSKGFRNWDVRSWGGDAPATTYSMVYSNASMQTNACYIAIGSDQATSAADWANPVWFAWKEGDAEVEVKKNLTTEEKTVQNNAVFGLLGREYGSELHFAANSCPNVFDAVYTGSTIWAYNDPIMLAYRNDQLDLTIRMRMYLTEPDAASNGQPYLRVEEVQ